MTDIESTIALLTHIPEAWRTAPPLSREQEQQRDLLRRAGLIELRGKITLNIKSEMYSCRMAFYGEAFSAKVFEAIKDQMPEGFKELWDKGKIPLPHSDLEWRINNGKAGMPQSDYPSYEEWEAEVWEYLSYILGNSGVPRVKRPGSLFIDCIENW